MTNIIAEIKRRIAVDEPASDKEFKAWTVLLVDYVEAAEAWINIERREDETTYVFETRSDIVEQRYLQARRALGLSGGEHERGK